MTILKLIDRALIPFFLGCLFLFSITDNNIVLNNLEWVDKYPIELFSTIFLICAVIFARKKISTFGVFIICCFTMAIHIIVFLQYYYYKNIDISIFINLSIFTILVIYDIYNKHTNKKFFEKILFFILLLLLRELIELSSLFEAFDLIQIIILALSAGAIVQTEPKDPVRVFAIAPIIFYSGVYIFYTSWITVDPILSVFIHIANMILIVYLSLKDLK